MLSLRQQQKLEQKLSPQQIQYQKLLQLNTLGLEQRIKTELELNPFLEGEMELREEEDSSQPDEVVGGDDDSEDGEATVDTDNEFTVEDYLNAEDYYDDPAIYKQQQTEDEKLQPFTPSKESLSEHLLNQLYVLDIEEPLMILGEEIIGNLDDDGYLKQDVKNLIDELELLHHIKVDPAKAEWLVKKIQTFDPVGIAARTLQECLITQIQHLSFDPYYSFLAEKMLTDHFEDFSHKRYDLLMQKMQLREETLRSVLDLIKHLNPKPGDGDLDYQEMNQITPDFVIEKDGADFHITLNDRSLPTITVNRTYLELLQKNKGKKKLSTGQKDTHLFLKEKFESAKWFIACIEQRRNTMLKVMRSILERQWPFFDNGPRHLKPMIYKDIADEIMMDISTISRVVSGKFVQSPQGIHELKYFFSEGLATDSGEEIANKQIKEMIKEMIEGESKRSPLSDDKIASVLNKQGIHIARRTVAKYREAMRVPVARLRKAI
ncbi:MAG: RNA polymerase factor sigma-54 [Ignavibacteriales bacterium]|nr:RNA polymerase factor sigma-54 [Ignavibacteriales bacterium]